MSSHVEQQPTRSTQKKRQQAASESAKPQPAAGPAAGAEVASGDDSPELSGGHAAPGGARSLVVGLGACGVSTFVHLVLLVLLGLWLVPIVSRTTVVTIVAEAIEELDEEVPVIELDEQLEAATTITDATLTSAPLVGAAGQADGGIETPRLDRKVVEEFDHTQMEVGDPTLVIPSTSKLIEAVPDGALGDPRAIVGDYQEALDRITQEIMWMLDQGDVLVVWCFDQSKSMKDDQQEISQRIHRIYKELGLAERAAGDHLLTAVTSFGGGQPILHTERPTNDVQAIRQAIDSVPIDATGEENMFQAISTSIVEHRNYARRGKRQMALILVTDESGNRVNNNRFLEQAIAEAKAARCKVYTLGRESMFGYPYAFMRYQHPQTYRIHWLRVDRGPETAFVELLQTNGFRARHDAFSSGFGPYEQTRISRETGGIFFMLPTVEKDLVAPEKRRYALEAMHAYRPDLRSRTEALDERDRYPLRTMIWQVIHDLNPYNTQAGRVIQMRMEFSLQRDQYVRQMRAEQQKAVAFLQYLAWAEGVMDEARPYRDQEISLRWQANYDLICAQLVAYQARLYEYGVTLEQFMQKPQTAAPTRPPNLRLVHWDVRGSKEIRDPEKSQPYIDRSKILFQQVIERHPGTPWAERAKSELRRGFGLRMAPDYHRPYVKVANPSPLPKL